MNDECGQRSATVYYGMPLLHHSRSYFPFEQIRKTMTASWTADVCRETMITCVWGTVQWKPSSRLCPGTAGPAKLSPGPSSAVGPMDHFAVLLFLNHDGLGCWFERKGLPSTDFAERIRRLASDQLGQKSTRTKYFLSISAVHFIVVNWFVPWSWVKNDEKYEVKKF